MVLSGWQVSGLTVVHRILCHFYPLHHQPPHQFRHVRLGNNGLVRRARDGNVGQAYVVFNVLGLL